MNRLISLFTAVLFGIGLIASPALAAEANTQTKAEAKQTQKIPDPHKVAKRVVSKVLTLLEKHRKTYKKHPQKLYAMINRVLIPHFDVDYMAKLVLGRHWRSATPQQRKHFTRLFKKMIVQTYGQALLAFDDEQIEYLPIRAEEGATDITFRARVTLENGDTIPVTLDMHLVNGMWKIYNGSVGNLSFIINYRSQFNAMISAGGLDTVIAKLEKRYGQGDNGTAQNGQSS